MLNPLGSHRSQGQCLSPISFLVEERARFATDPRKTAYAKLLKQDLCRYCSSFAKNIKIMASSKVRVSVKCLTIVGICSG